MTQEAMVEKTVRDSADIRRIDSEKQLSPAHLELSGDTQLWLALVLEDEIQRVYDDPSVIAGDSLEGLQHEIRAMKELVASLGLNFDQIVTEKTTAFERKRMEVLLPHPKWTPEIMDQLDEMYSSRE